MLRRKRFAIVTEEGITLGDGKLYEDETLEAFGLELDEDSPSIVEIDDIKYELIDYIRGKATDLIIFMKYRYMGSHIDCQCILRIKMGQSCMDFPIFDLKTAERVFGKRYHKVVYRFMKIAKINRCAKPEKVYNFYSKLKGDTLADIVEKKNTEKQQFPKKQSNKN